MAKQISLFTRNRHTVDVQIRGASYTVLIDGREYSTFKLSVTSVWFGAQEDFPISMDGTGYIVAVRRKKIRLVKDGKYLDNGETFVPATGLPKWFWIFVALNLLIAVVGKGGAFHILAGLAGATFCGGVARGKMRTVLKIGICILITAGVWVTWLFTIGAIYLDVLGFK